MVQFSYNAHTAPQRTLGCRPCLGGLNKVYGPNRLTPSVSNIHGEYINFFTRCTISNQHDIIKKADADVSKGQTDMSYTSELQAFTKLSMKHQVCPSDTCCVIISESILTMFMSRGRSNMGSTHFVQL